MTAYFTYQENSKHADLRNPRAHLRRRSSSPRRRPDQRRRRRHHRRRSRTRATRPRPTTSRPPSSPASSTRTSQLLVKVPKLRSWLSRKGGVGRRDDRAAGRFAPAWHGGPRGRALRGPPRRLPDQDGTRSHPGRAGRRRSTLQERPRRHHRGAGDGPRRGHHRLRRRAFARARRQRGDQELQRRHVGRPRRRRRAAERGQRRHRHRGGARPSVVAKSANGDVRLGEARARLGRRRDEGRRPRGRASARARPPGSTSARRRSGAQRARAADAPDRRPRPSRCALAPPSATSSSGAPRARLSCPRSAPHAPRDSARSAPRCPRRSRAAAGTPRRRRPRRARRRGSRARARSG